MDRRLTKLKDYLAPVPPTAQIAICRESDWPPAAWRQLIAANTAGDLSVFADVVERQIGIRPALGTGRPGAVIIHRVLRAA